MRSVKFSNPKGLAFLEGVVGHVFGLWAEHWSSLSGLPVSRLEGHQTHHLHDEQQWLSCRIGKGYAFISFSDVYMIALSKFILGVEIADEERQKPLIQALLRDACKDLFNHLSDELYQSEPDDFCQDRAPVLNISGLDIGGYQFENHLLNLVIESQVLEVLPTAEYQLVPRKESLRNIDVNLDVYIPASKFNLTDIINIKKGSILITDSKIGSDLNIKINDQSVHTGRLGKNNEVMALKIIK